MYPPAPAPGLGSKVLDRRSSLSGRKTPAAVLVVALAITLVPVPASAAAQDTPPSATPSTERPGTTAADRDARDDEIEQLRAAVEQLLRRQEEISAQLLALQQELHTTETSRRREALREAARTRAGTEATGTTTQQDIDATTVFRSGTRMQSQLNPEISVTGDLAAIASDRDAERFSNREWEVDFQSDLDPYSRMRLTIALPEGEDVEVEEGYINWMNLPGGLGLTVGRRRQQFGVLNRFHQHALDQFDYPLVLQESFGEEGLAGTGVFLDWTLPPLWADALELTVEITNGDNDVAFAGNSFNSLAYLTRLKSYWDLGTNSYFEFGLNGLFGESDATVDLTNKFYGLDFTYNWTPFGRSLYRSLTLRGLVVRTAREMDMTSSLRAWGGYLYGEYKFARRFIAGVRFDRADDQLDAAAHTWGVSPYLTLWESEYVRIRSQFNYRDNNLTGVERSVLLQVTLSAGPHKHEAY